MTLRNYALIFLFVSLHSIAQQETKELTIYFESNETQVAEEDSKRLAELCFDIDPADVEQITLIGYADVRGSGQANYQLALRRAESVKQDLLTTCFNKVLISTQSKGSNEADAKPDDLTRLQGDRKVIVQLTLVESEYEISVQLPDAAQQLCHPVIRPLIPAVDKHFEVHTVDPTKEIRFIATDGVHVIIPANAIVNTNGDVIKEPVEIAYRSFAEPYEIIASGIPMHIDTDEGVGHFETAGMYELTASLNNNQLGLAPDNQIQLIRPDTDPIPVGYGTYSIDATSGKWQANGSLSVTPDTVTRNAVSSSIQIVTQAMKKYRRKMAQHAAGVEPSQIRFNERLESPTYGGTKLIDERKTLKRVSASRDPYKRQGTIPAIRIVPTTYERYKKTKDTGFTVKFVRGRSTFREWRHLPSQVEFVHNGDESRRRFKKVFAAKHWYQDLVLDIPSGSNAGTLKLKEDGKWRTIPILIREKENSTLLRKWDTNYERYKRTRAARIERFDKKLQERHDLWAERDSLCMPKSWNYAKAKMTPAEDSMSMKAFNQYAQAPRVVSPTFGAMEAVYKNLSTVQNTFNLNGFGVYNIDRIMKMSSQNNLLATAVLSDGSPFEWLSAYGVLKWEQSVITYWGNGTPTCSMLVATGRMKSLFFVAEDGTIAIADVDPLNEKTPKATIVCTLLEDPESIEDIRLAAAQ